MKVRYRVKLNNPKKAKKLNNNGYLDGGFGRIGSYTRGDAIKKAKAFDGEIERIVESFIITDAKMAQINENALLDGVVKALKGREQFEDTEETLGERIYNADVIEDILGEQSELQKAAKKKQLVKGFLLLSDKSIAQLEELSDALGEYQYLQITVI